MPRVRRNYHRHSAGPDQQVKIAQKRPGFLEPKTSAQQQKQQHHRRHQHYLTRNKAASALTTLSPPPAFATTATATTASAALKDVHDKLVGCGPREGSADVLRRTVGQGRPTLVHETRQSRMKAINTTPAHGVTKFSAILPRKCSHGCVAKI